LSAEIHRADWTIPYPETCDPDHIPILLQPFTLVEHTGEAPPWHLTTKALNLLECPQEGYEYLHLVWFFRARAAMLALQGSVLDHKDLFRALSKHRVQAAGIYREHLIFNVREFLRKQNLVGLPGCHCENSAAVEENEKAERNRVVIRAILRGAEIEYLRTLNFISAATTMEEEVARHSVGFWAAGAEMPKGLDIQVRVRRFDGGYEVRPTENDIKRMVREGTPMRKIRVTNAEGGPAHAKGSGVAVPPVAGSEDRGAVRDATAMKARECATQGGKPVAGKGWKVVGDFHMIIPPNGQKHINLATKHKARAFLRFIHEQITESGVPEFYVEQMRQEFNAQFSRDLAHRQWVSDRFREDLFRGKEREFDLLFERLDKAAGRYRMRGMGGNMSLSSRGGSACGGKRET
jgi:hypothetical protein